MSRGSVGAYKPFYIKNANENERVMCMCQPCLNTRLQFDAIMKKIPSRSFKSITDYFMYNVRCAKGTNGYFDYICAKGECDDCKDASMPVLSIEGNLVVNYYQYQVVKNEVPTMTGEVKIVTSSERVNCSEHFDECVTKLNALKSKYILHRYYVCNHKKVFDEICETIPSIGPIYWWDYSENVKNTPKFEAQEHGYCAKQISLFCTVNMLGNNKREYIYHFCDNNLHDVCFTGTVAEDIFEHHFEGDIFRVKSDNCKVQFKCKWVFAFWKRFSAKHGIPVILYYGVEGHGKGLVDAMGSFGVKQPIRQEIIRTDFWYRKASDLVSFLRMKYIDDPSKIYKEVDQLDLLSKQNDHFGLGECKIPGMVKMRMISFFPDGTIKGANDYCSCQNCLAGHFNKCDRCDGCIIIDNEDDKSENENDIQ